MTPSNQTTSFAIQKVYSDNDINYNTATLNDRFALSADFIAPNYCQHSSNQDYEKLTPEDQQHSYHTL